LVHQDGGGAGAGGGHIVAGMPQRQWQRRQRPTLLTSAQSSRSPPMRQLMVHPVLGGVSGEGWASLVGGLCPHMLHLDATINGVSSFVIFDGNFLLAARQFSPPEAANSQFWLCSHMHKLCPCVTPLPKPWGHSIIIANSILQGLIFDEYVVGQNWQERGGLVLSLVPLQFLFGSFEYVQNIWSTLIGSNFKKKHVELFFIFIQASIVFYE
jgi:hypothetical protein